MKKIYIILIVVLVLSSSGVGIFVWSKKKKAKDKAQEKQQEQKAPKPIEKPIESKVKSEIPKELIADISIDYVDPNKLELGYIMQYKGLSHEGTFKNGDQKSFIKKSMASFSVFQLMLEESGITDKPQPDPTKQRGPTQNTIHSVAKVAEAPIVYLFILNNKDEAVEGLKVNLQTGVQTEGLPKDFPEFDGLD